MGNINTHIELAELYFMELMKTASLRSYFNDLVLTKSQILFSAFSVDKNLQNRLRESMSLKEIDDSALLKGLFLQSVSVYENYIKGMVSCIIQMNINKASKYSELTTQLKNGFISNAGKALSYYGGGTVNGVRFDFDALTESLKLCLTDEQPYHIDATVFTILMGNCTSQRLQKLLEKIGHSSDIFKDISDDGGLKKVLKETRKAQINHMTKEKLDLIMDLRNDIAHGDLTRTLNKDEFDDYVQFLRSLIGALSLTFK